MPARFAPQARRDIRLAAGWLHGESPKAALALRIATAAGARLIGIHPEAGALRPELAPAPIRFLPLRGQPYLLAYEVGADGLPVILRVLHAARDIPTILGREPG